MTNQQQRIYLDHAATCPLDADVWQAMQAKVEASQANASSLHSEGQSAKQLLTEARQRVALQLGATSAEQVIFTSGATESNLMVLQGLLWDGTETPKHLVTTAIEHDAILAPARFLQERIPSLKVTYLIPDAEGFIYPEQLQQVLREHPATLVSIAHANNEIGTIQPLKALVEVAHQYGALCHSDATQTVGKLPLSVSETALDYLSCSAHKLYGPKGIGAFYRAAKAPKPTPLLHGGLQEFGVRAGTSNPLQAYGFALALEKALALLPQESDRLRVLTHRFKAALITALNETLNLKDPLEWNGPRDLSQTLPGLLNVSLPYWRGDSLVLRLDMAGFAVSSGSACHAEVIRPSHVVSALGKSEAIASSTLRLSMGRSTQWEDLEALIQTLTRLVHKAQNASSAKVRSV
jgi:cysteine desulfurase